MLSKKAKGWQNRRDVLAMLASLGYGTAKQIAMALWGRVTPSTRKMANRSISWLVNAGYLVERRDDHSVSGERLVALTVAGAAEASRTLPKERAHARDWLRHAHAHRTVSNSVFLGATTQFKALSGGYTEFEIQTGEAPPALSRYVYRDADGCDQGKIPDCIIRLEDGRYVWIEVENAYRGSRDFAKVISWMRVMFNPKNPPPPVAEVWFVVTSSGAKTIGNRLGTALGPGDPHTDGRGRLLRELDAHILAERVKVFEFDHDTLTLKLMER